MDQDWEEHVATAWAASDTWPEDDAAGFGPPISRATSGRWPTTPVC